MSYRPEDTMMSRDFVARRLQVHAGEYLRLMPMFKSTVRAIEWIDRGLERSVAVIADMAAGETTDESRQVEQEFRFPVFRTWWDHLKYDLKEGRIGWLPEWLKARMRVEYQDVVKKASMSVPVMVTRACPHAGFEWNDRDEHHIRFLFPSAFNGKTA